MTEVACYETVAIAPSFIIPLGGTGSLPVPASSDGRWKLFTEQRTLNVRACRFTGATSAHYRMRNARFAGFE